MRLSMESTDLRRLATELGVTPKILHKRPAAQCEVVSKQFPSLANKAMTHEESIVDSHRETTNHPDSGGVNPSIRLPQNQIEKRINQPEIFWQRTACHSSFFLRAYMQPHTDIPSL